MAAKQTYGMLYTRRVLARPRDPPRPASFRPMMVSSLGDNGGEACILVLEAIVDGRARSIRP